jgi:hypothetical protein
MPPLHIDFFCAVTPTALMICLADQAGMFRYLSRDRSQNSACTVRLTASKPAGLAAVILWYLEQALRSYFNRKRKAIHPNSGSTGVAAAAVLTTAACVMGLGCASSVVLIVPRPCSVHICTNVQDHAADTDRYKQREQQDLTGPLLSTTQYSWLFQPLPTHNGAQPTVQSPMHVGCQPAVGGQPGP